MKRRMNFFRKIKDVFLGLYLLQLFNYVAPIIIIPIIISHLGLTSFGELVYIASVYQIISLGVDYGFTYTAPVMAARLKNDELELKNYYSKIVFLKTLLYITLCSVAALLVLVGTIKLSILNLVIIFFCCIGNVVTPLWLFQGVGNFKLLANAQIISRILLFTSLLAYMIFGGHSLIVISFLQNGTLIVCLVFLRKHLWAIKLSSISLRESLDEFQKASNVFIGVLGTIGYGSLIPILIGNICGASSLAVYSVVQKMTAACQSLINPISQYMLSEVSKSYDNNTLFYKKIIKSFYIHLAISSATCIGYIIFGSFAAMIIGKIDVHYSIIFVSAFITIFSSLNNVLGVQMLIPKNEVKSLRAANLISGGLIAASSYYIILNYNVLGGVVLNLMGEVIVFLCLAIISIRRWRIDAN